MKVLRFCLFFYFLISLVVARAGVVQVCSDCKSTTLKSGIERANRHDTVLILPGIYQEYDVKVTKPLTLKGEDLPTIDGQFKGEIITVQSDSVNIDGLRVVNVGTSYTVDYAAIRIVQSKYFDIRNVVLEKLFFGIYLEKSSKGVIYGNRIKGNAKDEYNSGNGIHFWYSHSVHVEKNRIEKVRDGIYLEFADTVSIIDNYSKGNLRYGLHFMFSNDDVYRNNTFEENGAGVAVMFSRRIEMTNNTFINNWGSSSYGLLLKEISDAEISDNFFEGNTTAINIEGSNRINYRNNTFHSNGWALKVLGACYTNVFEYNNFLYNSFDVSYNAQINDNIFRKNYWSEYVGYDLDKDGLGDVPYRPVKLFNYIVSKAPESVLLLRSLFIDILNFAEKVSPLFTPKHVVDNEPLMKKHISS